MHPILKLKLLSRQKQKTQPVKFPIITESGAKLYCTPWLQPDDLLNRIRRAWL